MSKLTVLLSAGVTFAWVAFGTASAQSLPEVLARTYAHNHELNGSRAQLRATDETVTQARSALRPQIGSSSTATSTQSRITFKNGRDSLGRLSGSTRSGALSSRVDISQVLFDGLRTSNDVRVAEATVFAARANLENDVQSILLDAATIYATIVRDRRVAGLRRQNLDFVFEQVASARERFRVGEGTRTDVAQTEAQQALATAVLNVSLAQVAASEASYLGIVGDPAGVLGSSTPPRRELLPGSLKVALAIADAEHPAVLVGKYSVEAETYNVASREGELLPTVTARGALDNTYRATEPLRTLPEGSPSDLPGVRSPQVRTDNSASGTLSLQVEVPIYQGGLASSRVRAAKEVLAQRRIEADRLRREVRSRVEQRWAETMEARKNLVEFGRRVSAAQIALDGVIQERAVGQRTTLNVLEAQADVISARIRLADVERDIVTASYGLLYAIGRNSPERLKLDVERYDPNEHYDAVEDKWYGIRTPDGR